MWEPFGPPPREYNYHCSVCGMELLVNEAVVDAGIGMELLVNEAVVDAGIGMELLVNEAVVDAGIGMELLVNESVVDAGSGMAKFNNKYYEGYMPKVRCPGCNNYTMECVEEV